ncbi:hypothetical protein M0Q97_05875 [Candidatus Dojkabacteria bacterium]|jgi:hypothetical protein|nr:hypothetical protein [Candidatus Dojkabacteria bacterium]
MLNTLKKLPYISLKESENLDDINIIYVENNGGVFTKKMRCDFFEIDNLNRLPDAIEQLFIDKIISIVKNPISIKLKETKATIDSCFNSIKPINDKYQNSDRFIIFSDNINKHFINETFDYPVHILASQYLDDNIVILGFKTKIDQPGIILVTNKNGIKNKNKIQLLVDIIGYFPNKMYFILKIK